ncbi:MAG: serine hydrolase, partial [Bryobacteraceae bacterium]|nr:serine hydrolase [Bryobacteraceae bacterium]
DTVRPDMTFSVAKSFLSTTVGVAFDHGLIRDLNDPVKNYVPDPALFSGDRNSRVTWDHLLRQTSDWEGTLWGKPDWADRPPASRPLQENVERQRNEPGTSWKYNDVRVNLLALAALHVWRKPLPLVLKENLLDPIGASNTWRWYGYENSWLNLDGVMVQSVSGGSHWGGGMFISARDMARFGLLTLNNGNWAGKEIISPKWIAMAKTPTGPNPGYGFMNWYLNTGRKFLPGMPESTFCHVGNGTNAICVDPELDIVTVVRWIDSAALNAVLVKIRTAMN